MKRGKNEKVWFCLEAGWKIWYDYGKMADLGNPVKMNKTGENDMKNKLLRELNSYGKKVKIFRNSDEAWEFISRKY